VIDLAYCPKSNKGIAAASGVKNSDDYNAVEVFSSDWLDYRPHAFAPSSIVLFSRSKMPALANAEFASSVAIWASLGSTMLPTPVPVRASPSDSDESLRAGSSIAPSTAPLIAPLANFPPVAAEIVPPISAPSTDRTTTECYCLPAASPPPTTLPTRSRCQISLRIAPTSLHPQRHSRRLAPGSSSHCHQSQVSNPLQMRQSNPA
jgi:hypothetical protein